MSGLFGVVSKKNCVEDLFYGTDYLSHMGTEFGGLSVINNPSQSDSRIIRRIHSISQGQFKSKFYDDFKDLIGQWGIGVISDKDEQPIFLNTKFGPMALCTAGLIENHEELIEELLRDGDSFSETTAGHSNSTEIVAKIIAKGSSMVDGIKKVFSKIKGSCTLMLLTREGIYVARDRYGYVPIVIGKRGDDFAITTETTGFANLGFEIKKYLIPGEIILINDSGIQSISNGNTEKFQICTFLWIYTGFPASSYEGFSAEIVRERCGSFLAKRDNVKADFVCGVPDSGVAHAIGYAMEAKIPYRRALIKYTPGYGRSYTPPSQIIRDRVAKMKLIPIKDIIKGNRIAVCEDSIVRGTQLKNFTIQKLLNNGAKEIHIRPACPPLLFPCRFCLSTRTKIELVARRAIKDIEGKDIENVNEYIDYSSKKYAKMIEWIRKDLGVDTLQYQRLDDMINAVGLPKENLCLYCWTGECRDKSNLMEKGDSEYSESILTEALKMK